MEISILIKKKKPFSSQRQTVHHPHNCLNFKHILKLEKNVNKIQIQSNFNGQLLRTAAHNEILCLIEIP